LQEDDKRKQGIRIKLCRISYNHHIISAITYFFLYIYFTYSAIVRLFTLYPFNEMSPVLYLAWHKIGDETKIYTH